MAKDKEQILEQPNETEQRRYLSMANDDYTICKIGGTNKKYKIYWLRNGQINKLSRVLLQKKREDDNEEGDKKPDVLGAIHNDAKLACKAAAIYTLNRWWKLKLLYAWRWRWFYYVKEYTFSELQEIIMEGKKKVPQMPFYAVTTLLIGAKATLMTMRAKEVEAFLHEQDMAQRTHQQKSGNG